MINKINSRFNGPLESDKIDVCFNNINKDIIELFNNINQHIANTNNINIDLITKVKRRGIYGITKKSF